MKLMSRNSGFTLIELLISISIVGVVFGVIISSSAAVQRNSRNTQRKADLSRVQSALQNYFADRDVYPDNTFSLYPPSANLTNCSGSSSTPPCTNPTKTYLEQIPSDPTTGTPTPYCYKPYISSRDLLTVCNNGDPTKLCHYYILCATLENEGVPSSACQTACGSALYNFELSPL